MVPRDKRELFAIGAEPWRGIKVCAARDHGDLARPDVHHSDAVLGLDLRAGAFIVDLAAMVLQDAVDLAAALIHDHVGIAHGVVGIFLGDGHRCNGVIANLLCIDARVCKVCKVGDALGCCYCRASIFVHSVPGVQRGALRCQLLDLAIIIISFGKEGRMPSAFIWSKLTPQDGMRVVIHHQVVDAVDL
eukprot:GEZU01008993.1.p1 GENE.GEZU01008993.1~~GEZU01008993.1.p1  ORF type:complete len:189 (+),score=18.69 GEZU01008993.1:245-811(+)